MHGSALYERRDLTRLEPADVERVQAFLAGQRELQARLLAGLRADPRTAAAAGEEIVRRNRRLVWTWDSLSLGLLLDWAPFELAAVPADGRRGRHRGAARRGRCAHARPVAVRRSAPDGALRGPPARRPVRRRATMQDALAAAPWVTVELELLSDSHAA